MNRQLGRDDQPAPHARSSTRNARRAFIGVRAGLRAVVWPVDDNGRRAGIVRYACIRNTRVIRRRRCLGVSRGDSIGSDAREPASSRAEIGGRCSLESWSLVFAAGTGGIQSRQR